MTIIDFQSRDPFNDVEEIDRRQVKTLFSSGHYDGPMNGVVLYEGKKYWAHCPSLDIHPRKFLMVPISEEDAALLEESSREWASCTDEKRSEYSKRNIELRYKLDSTGDIIGYFECRKER